MLNTANKVKTIKQNKKIKLVLYLLFILLVSCMGNQQTINNKTDKEPSTDESTRDRTPSAPRINVPAHTF